MGQPRPLFRLFSVFSDKQYNFYNKSMFVAIVYISIADIGIVLAQTSFQIARIKENCTTAKLSN